MGLRIDSTVSSLIAARQVNGASGRVTKGLGQLASGLRINSAAVDAAGLAISESLSASIRQLNQESRNFQSGINLTETAEGGLAQQQEAVGRLQELAVQASNGTLTDDQRNAINAEAQELVGAIDSISSQTSFNGVQPLNGSTETVAFDGGTGPTVELTESTAQSLGISDIDLSSQEGAAAAVATASAASDRISETRASLGAQQNRLRAAIDSRESQAVNEAESLSRTRDLDIARASIEQTLAQIQQSASIAVLGQSNVQSELASRLLTG